MGGKEWINIRKNKNGITLISLVISIIVMLILAGVSINAVIGDNGIINQAQLATISSRMAQLKEELEMNIAGAMMGEGINKREQVTVLNSNIRNYIPIIEDSEIGKYGVVAGELYYIGEDALYKSAAEMQGIKVIPEGTSAEDFIKEIENLAIDSIVKNMGGDAFEYTDNEGNSQYQGVKLIDKSIANSTSWKIITDTDSNKNILATYGTGWYFVEKGTEIENIGVLKQDYIINYTMRKAVKFDAEKHSMLSWDSSLAVSSDLLFTIDPSIIETANQGDTTWANGLTAYGYQADYSDAFSSVGMKFDGEDDYLKIPGNTSKITEHGFTYEFYGIPKAASYQLYDVTDKEKNEDGTWPNYLPDYTLIKTVEQPNGRIYQTYEERKMTGILSFGKDDYSVRAMIKLMFRNDSIHETLADNQIGNFYLNYGYGSSYKIPKLDENGNEMYDENGNLITTLVEPTTLLDNDGNPVLNSNGNEVKSRDTITPWSTFWWCNTPTDYWNQSINLYNYGIELYYGQEIYYAIVINPEKDTQSFYVNGELVDEVQLNTNAWGQLCQEIEEQGAEGYWMVGRATEGSADHRSTFEGEIYTTRIYERPLTAEELKANYNATIAYHNVMVNTNQGTTGGNISGEDLEDIN